MAKNRKAATEFIAHWLDELLPGGGNGKLMQEMLDSLSDSEFDSLMQRYASGEDRPVLYAPNFAKASLNTTRNLEVAKKLGHDFFERVWVHSDDGQSPAYLSNNKFMIVELPVRRQAQLLVKKLSVPEHNRSIDQVTNQPSGGSRASGISYMEVQVLRSMGMTDSLKELISFRGGDTGSFNAMNTLIARDGGASQTAIEPHSTGVGATAALKTYLTCMHLKNTL